MVCGAVCECGGDITRYVVTRDIMKGVRLIFNLPKENRLGLARVSFARHSRKAAGLRRSFPGVD